MEPVENGTRGKGGSILHRRKLTGGNVCNIRNFQRGGSIYHGEKLTEGSIYHGEKWTGGPFTSAKSGPGVHFAQ